MTSFWSKLNHNLTAIYRLYLDGPSGGPPVEVALTMLYDGNLAALESLGFRTHSSSIRRAVGYVDLADLEQLATHPGVVHLAVESVPKPMLVNSVGAIHVREDVWKRSGDRFTGTTGKGVIIGIIDTGIDFTHDHFFETPDTTPPKTRILRIWDQILVPVAGEHRPDVALLEPANLHEVIKTYGVEYTQTQLNTALATNDPRGLIRHHDKDGHGTSVAGVAAGNGGKKRNLGGGYIGVAPCAELIVVNLGESAGPETPPSFYDRMRHAVNYIINVAKNEPKPKPVVINMSLGDAMEPHDGRSSDELFLTERFAGATGRALTVAAGNSAGVFRRTPGSTDEAARLHATVTFRRGQTATLDVELVERLHVAGGRRAASIAIYYPLTAKLTFKVRRGADWKAVGQALDQPLPSPEPQYRNWPVTFRHATEVSFTPSDVKVERCNAFNFLVHQNAMEGMPAGTFTIELTLDQDAVGHVYCSDVRELDGTGFRIRSGSPAEAVQIEDRYLIPSPGGAGNIFTVASFDHFRDKNPVAAHSSRGPIAQYGGPTPLPKPDIAAPGQAINTARSSEMGPPFRLSELDRQDGTSLAAPHVAGTIALLFETKNDLTYDQLRNALKPEKPPKPPVPDELGLGPLNGHEAVEKVKSGRI
jgi:subtilisin family serine protease